MKWHKSLLLIGLFLVISMQVYAAPPVTTLGSGITSGITLALPKYEYLTQNQNYTMFLHIYNSSNGMPLRTTASCYVDIYNPTGFEILGTRTLTKNADQLDYYAVIDKSNQSVTGLYSYIAWCNSTLQKIGGFADGSYVVVKDTQLYRLLDGKPYFSFTIIFFMFAIAFFLLYFSNQFKPEGEPWGITITKIATSTLLKLMSLGTVIYSMFLYKNATPDITHVTSVFDKYMEMFIWGIIIFFIIYFIHQFVVFVTNLNVKKDNEGRRLGE